MTALEQMPHAEIIREVATLREQVQQRNDTIDLLIGESITDLQLAMDDVGWRRAVAQSEQEFTREGLRLITAACQLYALANPLIKHGLSLRQVYVWGSGVEISARANARRDRSGEQDVNAVIQAFLDDVGNRNAFTGPAARQRLERGLGTDGNLFLSCWTRPRSGRVQVRILPWEEICDVFCNPEDRSEPWFYHRRWFEQAQPGEAPRPREAYYPAINYRPASRPRSINEVEVRWDAPVRHVKVNDLEGWKFGVGDAYAAINWARAYKDFLEDWVKLVRALSKFAWRLTAKGASQASQMRTKMGAINAEPAAVAGTAIMPADIALEAIPKTGATIDAESGRPLAMMVGSALGVPVTMLLADPGQTGARAVAETLDQPFELGMQQRRDLWTEAIRDICEYVIREAVRAPQGPLKGAVRRDEDGREVVALAGDTVQTIDVAWPELDDVDPAAVVDAVVAAAGTGTVPPELVLRLLLTALGVRHVDEIVEELVDDDGKFLWPEAPPVGVGQQAADAQRNGDDPAQAGDGPMGGGDEPAADDNQDGTEDDEDTADSRQPRRRRRVNKDGDGDGVAGER